MYKELPKMKIDERTGIEYRLEGNYYIPNLVLPKQEKVTLNKYGRIRLKYLKENREAEYTIMLMDGTLYKHLLGVQELATNRINMLMKQLAEKENITEELKATDQLKWVGMMNNIKNQAEEVVIKEVVYGK